MKKFCLPLRLFTLVVIPGFFVMEHSFLEIWCFSFVQFRDGIMLFRCHSESTLKRNDRCIDARLAMLTWRNAERKCARGNANSWPEGTHRIKNHTWVGYPCIRGHRFYTGEKPKVPPIWLRFLSPKGQDRRVEAGEELRGKKVRSRGLRVPPNPLNTVTKFGNPFNFAQISGKDI